MKQNITEEQLNELSQKQKLNLFTWWSSNYHLKPVPESQGKYLYGNNMLLSIGQMIEFLNEHLKRNMFIYQVYKQTQVPLQTKWKVQNEINEPSDIELCDTLWKAVKDILEKE